MGLKLPKHRDAERSAVHPAVSASDIWAIARNEAFAEQPTKVRSVENAGGVAVVVRVDHKAR